MRNATTKGMVLGKFMPPHLGHLYLLEFAANYVDELFIVVDCPGEAEPISQEQRVNWLKELIPAATVLALPDINPQQPEEAENFWEIWQKSLKNILGQEIDFIFASESYGQNLAELLSCKFISVDAARSSVPVSGTQIRENPFDCWGFIPRAVRPYFTKRVCVFGPESTGKSTLTVNLAKHFGTVAVPEYARTLIELNDGKIEYNDMELIARAQAASEDALVKNAEKYLFCDTDPLTTKIWSEWLYQKCPEWIEEEIKRRKYDLYLLTDVGVPWVKDIVRYLPEEGEAFLARCEEVLNEYGCNYVRVSGSWEERFNSAVEAVLSL